MLIQEPPWIHQIGAPASSPPALVHPRARYHTDSLLAPASTSLYASSWSTSYPLSPSFPRYFLISFVFSPQVDLPPSRSKVIFAMVCAFLSSGPSLSFPLVLAWQLYTRAKPSPSWPRTHNDDENRGEWVFPTLDPFSVLALQLQYGNVAYGWLITFAIWDTLLFSALGPALSWRYELLRSAVFSLVLLSRFLLSRVFPFNTDGRHCCWYGAPRSLSVVRSLEVGWTLVFDF